MLDDLPEDRTPRETEQVRRIRSRFLRGDADYEAGRTLTHDEFRARMAPGLPADVNRRRYSRH